MKSFYCQQILGTLCILGLTLAAFNLLSPDQKPVPTHLRLAERVKPRQPQARVETEPRDPQTSGELARHHHLDAYGYERKTEIDFADQSKAVIEYSAFGKPSKVTETAKNGASRIYQLDPTGKRLLKIEERRSDGSLAAQLEPTAKGMIKRSLFREDGTTLACRQEIKSDGSITAELMDESGKHVIACYKKDAGPAPAGPHGEWQEPQPTVATLEFFDEAGKLCRSEKITHEPCGECGGECGNYQEYVEVKVFRKDGSLDFEQSWQYYQDDNGTLGSATAYAGDGKQKSLQLASCYQKVADKHAYRKLEYFDEAGKLDKTCFLAGDGRVMLEKDKQGKEQIMDSQNSAKIDLPFMQLPRFKSLNKEFFDNKLGPNRLGQILSN